MNRIQVKASEGAKSTFRAVIARALAQALIDGIDNAAEEGRGLTLLLQRVGVGHDRHRRQVGLQGEGALDVDAMIDAVVQQQRRAAGKR